MTAELFLSAKDVAVRMSLSTRQVRNLIARRQMRHVNIGGRYLVPETAVAEFLNRYTVEPLPLHVTPQTRGVGNAT